MKILGVVMLLVGIVCLVSTIVFMVRLKIWGNRIFEMSVALDCDEFTIKEPGKYAVWLRAPIGKIVYPRLNVVINEVYTGREIPVYATVFNVKKSSFTHCDRQRFTFEAEPGSYLMSVQRNTNFEDTPVIGGLFKMNEAQLDRFSLFITKRVNPFLIVVGIVLLLISILAIVFSPFLIFGVF